jgi:glutamate-ammonia-ligase adenylyltransferase
MQEGSNAAWIWEHQALTRARFCAGNEIVRSRFDAIRKKVICMRRDPVQLRDHITQMRTRIHEGHPNRSGNFDLKHDSGGMVDIEFMIQWIVLLYAHQYDQLLGNVGNIALLQIAADLKILDEKSALEVSNAYRLLRKKQHQLRLDGNSLARVSQEEYLEFFDDAVKSVIQVWQKLMLLDQLPSNSLA